MCLCVCACVRACVYAVFLSSPPPPILLSSQLLFCVCAPMCVCLFVGVGGVSVVLCVGMQTVSSNVTKHTVLSARAAGVGGSGSSRRSPGGGGASVHARLHRPAAGATGRVGGALQRHHHGPHPHHHRADDRHRSPPGGARPLLLRRRRKSLQLAPHAHRR